VIDEAIKGNEMNGRVYEQSRWSLADLISASDRPEEIGSEYLDQLEQVVSDLETKRSMLSPEMNPNDFITVLEIVEHIGSLVRRLEAYGQLWFAEDTHNQDALSFRGWMTPLPNSSFLQVAIYPTTCSRFVATSHTPSPNPWRR